MEVSLAPIYYYLIQIVVSESNYQSNIVSESYIIPVKVPTNQERGAVDISYGIVANEIELWEHWYRPRRGGLRPDHGALPPCCPSLPPNALPCHRMHSLCIVLPNAVLPYWCSPCSSDRPKMGMEVQTYYVGAEQNWDRDRGNNHTSSTKRIVDAYEFKGSCTTAECFIQTLSGSELLIHQSDHQAEWNKGT